MGGPDAATVRPPPGVEGAPRRPVETVRREEKNHDDLLAAFLADAPLDSKPPPKP